MTAVQKRAMKEMYKKQYMQSFSNELKVVADREGRKAARDLAKDPKFKKQIQDLVIKFLKTEMPKIIEDMCRNATIDLC